MDTLDQLGAQRHPVLHRRHRRPDDPRSARARHRTGGRRPRRRRASRSDSAPRASSATTSTARSSWSRTSSPTATSIRVAGVTGTVEDFSLRRTTLRDLDGIVHTVPNGEIKVASNLTRTWARINQDVTVAYGTDIDKAIAVVDAVGQRDGGRPGLEAAGPRAAARRAGRGAREYGITLKILGTVAPPTSGPRRRAPQALLDAFGANGIEIPRPQRVVLLAIRPASPARPAEARTNRCRLTDWPRRLARADRVACRPPSRSPACWPCQTASASAGRSASCHRPSTSSRRSAALSRDCRRSRRGTFGLVRLHGHEQRFVRPPSAAGPPRGRFVLKPESASVRRRRRRRPRRRSPRCRWDRPAPTNARRGRRSRAALRDPDRPRLLSSTWSTPSRSSVTIGVVLHGIEPSIIESSSAATARPSPGARSGSSRTNRCFVSGSVADRGLRRFDAPASRPRPDHRGPTGTHRRGGHGAPPRPDVGVTRAPR